MGPVRELVAPRPVKVPGWLVIVLGGGATGLLAPILLGLPPGLLVQAAVCGEAMPAGDADLRPWVFAVVYAGFGLLGTALAVLVTLYVAQRWGHVFAASPRTPSPAAVTAGVLSLLPFAAAMLSWGVRGPGDSGPQGMESPAQRTVLVVTGLLAAAALVVPLLPGPAEGGPRLAWAITWTGCTTAALQGPAQLLLAHGGNVRPLVALVALLATPGSCVYGLNILASRCMEAHCHNASTPAAGTYAR